MGLTDFFNVQGLVSNFLGLGGADNDSNGSGIGGAIRNHDWLSGAAIAATLDYADGEEGGTLRGVFENALDFMAAQDVADGDGTTLSKLYLAYRTASVINHQMDSRGAGTISSALAAFAGAAGAYMAMNKWENTSQRALQPALAMGR